MIDLHTHSLLSDGALLPSELARRAQVTGYRAIAITDHADASNMSAIIPRLVEDCTMLNRYCKIRSIPGIELTHLPPETIPSMAEEAKKLGAQLIVVHGETIVEPVAPGTNRAALEAPIHILAHPGLISAEEVKMAKERGIFLEISARKGHCLTNGFVARLAEEIGAPLILNTDAHEPGDLITLEQSQRVARGAGLTEDGVARIIRNGKNLVDMVAQGGL